MNILLIAEHYDQILSEQTRKLLNAVRTLNGRVNILVAGHNIGDVAASAAELPIIDNVLVADAPSLKHQMPEPLADLIVDLAKDYDVIAAVATSIGKRTMPRVAALLDVMQISEVIDIVDATTFRRPIYAGNAVQTVQSNDKIKVITIRSAAFAAAAGVGRASVHNVLTLDLPNRSRFVEKRASKSERPDLSSARIVVSGGRALGSKANFEDLILPLADKLGAAVGASRAAVDSGYAPNDWQVGQTGKIVAPELYIACGISGAIQHLAGIQDSKFIVAINKDADAPIFQVADVGLVADLFQAVPIIISALESPSELTREEAVVTTTA